MKLFLQIQIGRDAYLLEAARIICVLPLMDVKAIPHAPPGVAGVFNYHGTPVPLIDISELILGQPAPRHLSTRIVLVPHFVAHGVAGHWSTDRGADGSGVTGKECLLGLLAAQVTETIRCDPAYFFPAGVSTEAARYLGPVTMVGSRLLQLIEVPKLLPDTVSQALFRQVESPWEQRSRAP
jgi:chemotaxis-related protein WspB